MKLCPNSGAEFDKGSVLPGPHGSFVDRKGQKKVAIPALTPAYVKTMLKRSNRDGK